MPVSWHSRLSVSSATAMLRIMVPSMRFAPASVSAAASRSKPRLMSGGSSFRARMYSSLAASSTWARSTFIRDRPSLHGDLALLHHPRPERALLLHLARHLLRRVADRGEPLDVEPPAQVARFERLLRVDIHLLHDGLRRAGRRDQAEPAGVLEAGNGLADRRHAGKLRRFVLARHADCAQPPAGDVADGGGDVAEKEAGLARPRRGAAPAFALVGQRH